MYPFEREMKLYKNIPSNTRYSEGSIKENHLTSEGVVYAMEHVENTKDDNYKATRETFLDDDFEYNDEGPEGFGDKTMTLSDVQFIQIVRWVLFREVEGLADYYVEYCDELLVDINEIGSMSSEVQRQTNFIKWLYNKLVKEHKINSKL